MAIALSLREREVLEIVQDLGEPHILEILKHYHERYDKPLEAASVVRTLHRLVAKGSLSAERRPAAKQAPFEERMHFLATEAPTESEPDQAPGPSLKD